MTESRWLRDQLLKRYILPPQYFGYSIDESPRLKTIKGEFDLIFFDADKWNQTVYLDIILKQRLLSPKGIILVDNGK